MLKNGMFPSTITYNALINELCAGGRFGVALKIFYRMDGHSILNVQAYNEIIKGFCLMGNVKKVMVLFNKMLKVGPFPTVVMYNKLIN